MTDHGIVHGDEEGHALPPFDPDAEREAPPPRCNVRMLALRPPHDRCSSPNWPNHHHVFGG